MSRICFSRTIASQALFCPQKVQKVQKVRNVRDHVSKIIRSRTVDYDRAFKNARIELLSFDRDVPNWISCCYRFLCRVDIS